MEYTVQNLLSPYIYNDIADIYNPEIFSCFRNKTVFISGAGNLTGYYLTCSFLMGNDIDKNNTKIIVSDSDESLFEKYGKLTHRTDIDFLVTKDFSNMPREKADFIIHTEVTDATDYFEAVANLLDYGQQSGANMLICSDMDIYGTVYNGKDKLSESDMGYVDLSKAESLPIQNQRMVETYGRKLASNENLSIKFARTCSVLGAFGFNPLKDTLHTVAKGMQIIVDETDAVQSYCYVTDMATALLKVLTKGKNGEIYNISANCDTSMKHITELCLKQTPELNVAYKSQKNKNNSPMDSTYYILDNSKLLGLGFTPKVNLESCIKRMTDIMKNNL